MRRAILAILSLLALAVPVSAARLEANVGNGITFYDGCDGDDCYLTVPVFLTRENRGFFQAVGECAKIPKCKQELIDLANQYGGPDAAKGVSEVMDKYGSQPVASAETNGNETHIHIQVVPGYNFCRFRWHVFSKNGTGTFSAAWFAEPTQHVDFYANVPQGGWFEGQRWLDFYVEIQMRRIGSPRALCTTAGLLFDTGVGHRSPETGENPQN